MFEAIVTALAAVIIYWLKRRAKEEADKAAQLQTKLNKINNAIVKGDEDSVNSRIELLVNRLQDGGDGDTGGQGGKEDGEK